MISVAETDEALARFREADNAHLRNTGINMPPWAAILPTDCPGVPKGVMQRGRRHGLELAAMTRKVLASYSAMPVTHKHDMDGQGEGAKGAQKMETEELKSEEKNGGECHEDRAKGKLVDQPDHEGSKRTIETNKTRLSRKRKHPCPPHHDR